MVSTKSWLHVSSAALLATAVGAFVLGMTLMAHGQPTRRPVAVVTKVAAAPTKRPVAVVEKVAVAPTSAPLAHAALLAPAKIAVTAAPASHPANAPSVAVMVPASQPTIKVPVRFWPWLTANGNWFVPLLIFVLSSLATVLSKYPRTKGLVAALRMFLGGLSLLEFKDGKRSGVALKWPVSAPLPPPGVQPLGQPSSPGKEG